MIPQLDAGRGWDRSELGRHSRALRAGQNIHGEPAPMKTLTPSSLPPLKSAPFDRAAIAQDEAQLQAALVWMPGPDPVTPVVCGLPFLFKRAVDVVGASLGLFFLSPLLLFIAIRVRRDSPGPVLFRQVRRGHRGRPFQMLKFRTMTADAEQKLVAL